MQFIFYNQQCVFIYYEFILVKSTHKNKNKHKNMSINHKCN